MNVIFAVVGLRPKKNNREEADMPKKILIADDELEALSILEKKLKQSGYCCTAASKGEEALKMAKLDKPDLVILDIAMPDMDGYTIASRMKEDNALKDVPILFVTGKELEPKGIEERVENLGAFGYITKPCTFQEMLDKIKEFI